MYCLFAPDGEFQGLTLSPDFATCVASIRMLHKAGLGQSYHQLKLKGFVILPVKITMKQDGDENKPFAKNQGGGF